MNPKFNSGDRVYAKPCERDGTVTKVEWFEEIKLPDFSVPEGYIYWVKLDGKDVKPQGFRDRALEFSDRQNHDV